MTGRVGGGVRALGFAGLLPQAGAALMVAMDVDYGLGRLLALVYGGLILSFLGGVWWGFAMRRTDHQASLAALAVLPSLVALAANLLAARYGLPPALGLIAVALVATLAVDKALVATAEAPAGWLALRAPLSLGLAALTVAAALL